MATSYTEFNRDLFLCNTIPQDNDMRFTSMIIGNSSGNNVLSHNNLKNAMFFLIPKTKNYDIDTTWYRSRLSYPNNLSEFLKSMSKSKDICNNYPPYTISKTLYEVLNALDLSYSVFLNKVASGDYPKEKFIYAYTFGNLQVLDISSVTSSGVTTFKTTINDYGQNNEAFQNYQPVIEGMGGSLFAAAKRQQAANKAAAEKKAAELKARIGTAFQNVGTKIAVAKKAADLKKGIQNIGKAFKTVGTNIAQQAIQPVPKNLVQTINVLSDNKGNSRIEVTPAQTPAVVQANNKVISALKSGISNTFNDIKTKLISNTEFQNFFKSSCGQQAQRVIYNVFNQNPSQNSNKQKEGFVEGLNIFDPSPLIDNIVNTALSTSRKTNTYYTATTQYIYQLSDNLYELIDISCANYPISTVCPTNSQESANCEICKNFAYRDWYDSTNASSVKSFANHDDSKHEYFRTWVQTCNLGIGIFLLSIGIYYQSN
jgi:hypothetical protein